MAEFDAIVIGGGLADCIVVSMLYQSLSLTHPRSDVFI
jgi:hypothetical protein